LELGGTEYGEENPGVITRFTHVWTESEGATKPMIAAFLEDAKLSKKDIAELKAILKEKGKGT
jgi:predicted transcriptional regulator